MIHTAPRPERDQELSYQSISSTTFRTYRTAQSQKKSLSSTQSIALHLVDVLLNCALRSQGTEIL